VGWSQRRQWGALRPATGLGLVLQQAFKVQVWPAAGNLSLATKCANKRRRCSRFGGWRLHTHDYESYELGAHSVADVSKAGGLADAC